MRDFRTSGEPAGIGLGSVLSDILLAVPGRAATLYTPDLPLSDPRAIHLSQDFPDDALRDYLADFKHLDLWASAASHPRPPLSGSVFDTDRLVDRHRLLRSVFHADYLKRYDIGRCLVGIVDDGRGGARPRIRLTVVRAPSEPCFTAVEATALTQLTRAVRSFVALAEAHAEASRAAILQRAAFDRVRMPVFLVDPDRRILSANRSASDLLRSGGPLLMRGGRLETRIDVAGTELRHSLLRVAEAPNDVRFIRLGTGRRSTALVVTAVAEASAGDGRPALMVRVLEPSLAAGDAETVLTQLLNLTQPECAVALGIAEGLSHEEIAVRRGVKVTTVRTTLRRLQEKLGIQKSGPLAHFVQGLTALGGLRL